MDVREVVPAPMHRDLLLPIIKRPRNVNLPPAVLPSKNRGHQLPPAIALYHTIPYHIVPSRPTEGLTKGRIEAGGGGGENGVKRVHKIKGVKCWWGRGER